MNPVRYFNSDWWDIAARVDHAREKLLNKEIREVRAEMIAQEYLEGNKSSQQIATEYGVHKTTVIRFAKRKREEQ